MPINEIIFIVFIAAGFLFLLAVNGLFEALMDYLFNKNATPRPPGEVKQAAILGMGALAICILCLRYL